MCFDLSHRLTACISSSFGVSFQKNEQILLCLINMFLFCINMYMARLKCSRKTLQKCILTWHSITSMVNHYKIFVSYVSGQSWPLQRPRSVVCVVVATMLIHSATCAACLHQVIEDRKSRNLWNSHILITSGWQYTPRTSHGRHTTYVQLAFHTYAYGRMVRGAKYLFWSSYDLERTSWSHEMLLLYDKDGRVYFQNAKSTEIPKCPFSY